MRCERCNLAYPPDLTTPMFIARNDGSGYTAPVCGICALEISNEIHGDNRTKFTGTQAEALRQKAIKWRRARSARLETVRAAADRREPRR